MDDDVYLRHARHRLATRVAVTGGSGQIGSALRVELSRTHTVVGFDLRPRGVSRKLDVAGPRAVAELRKFDVIYHLAALISVPESLRDPLRFDRTNVHGSLCVLEAARLGDARLVFCSSAAVYGVPTRLPIGEDHPLRPISPYGLTKAIGEEYVRLYRELYGLDASIIRPFNVYSERVTRADPYAGVIRKFLDAARLGRPLVVNGDGRQTRDFVHVSDVVQLMGLLIDGRGSGRTYNCGSGHPTSIRELASWIRDRMDPDGGISYGPPRPGDIRHSVARIDRARSIGYRPRVTLRAWLAAQPTRTHRSRPQRTD